MSDYSKLSIHFSNTPASHIICRWVPTFWVPFCFIVGDLFISICDITFFWYHYKSDILDTWRKGTGFLIIEILHSIIAFLSHEYWFGCDKRVFMIGGYWKLVNIVSKFLYRDFPIGIKSFYDVCSYKSIRLQGVLPRLNTQTHETTRMIQVIR